ncbi:hypothetical protein [Blastococcus capsensis]|uniref:hypothetical protein n=1 Tax=Blastococcus capsensis TaxID=1564163 RepID=UPI002541A1F8|nr:hypothetical protein [Blastococcus capsensis]MDK3255261.1 hypothetical protein [Blastococcus capsensis]
MTRITAHFGINGPVPFLDVDVHQDNKLFLDPSAIRHAGGPMARRAHGLVLEFFREVMRCRTSPNRADREKGLALLQRLHEPNETRLGMSKAGSAGHAFGDELGSILWDVLDQPVFTADPIARRLEDLPLFVDRVGDDLVSDLTTRIVFEVLADFTAQQCALHPALAASVVTRDIDLWDIGSNDWVTRPVQLPWVAPHQLLLVPKEWVFWRMIMDPTAFYNHFGTGTVQMERTTTNLQGRKVAPSKESLKKEFPHVKELNIRQTVKYAHEEHRDLVAEYRDRVDAEFTYLVDDEIARRLA